MKIEFDVGVIKITKKGKTKIYEVDTTTLETTIKALQKLKDDGKV